MNSGLPAPAAGLGGVGIPGARLKFCRYYAKDKTCFYGDECQFLHEDPSVAGLSAHGSAGNPPPLSLSGAVGTTAAFPLGGTVGASVLGAGANIPKKTESVGPADPVLESQLFTIPGMEGGLSESSLTNSYFSSSFIGVNGFGSPAESKFSMMQRVTNSSNMPGLLNDKSYSAHDPVNSPASTLFNDFSVLSLSQKRKVFPTFHIYPPTAPHVAYMQPKANAPSFFMTDELRQELINRHLITMAQIDQSENPGVPAEVDSYHSLFPLEPLPPPNRLHKTSNFSYITSCYKAVNSKDDLPYCLRRIHGFRLPNTKCMTLVDMWKKIQHSNFVTLREVFTTKAFGDHSLVFAYDFHAGAETMFSRHFNDSVADSYFTKRKWAGQHEPPPPRQHAGLLPESLIWAYIVQLSSALRTIHTAGLACRVMDPSKILITGKTRLRVNCVGVFDVLTFDSNQTNPLALMPQYQQADLILLGKVVLALACNSLAGIQRENLQKAMELVSINYSSDLKNLILYLLTDQSRLRSVNDIMPMIGARFYTQLDASQMRSDVIEEDLAKEVQNGRLFRLLAKLGTITERPEFQKDPTWSETGDRYLLKLFRDHLFHQVAEAGTPWIDLSHIVSCLNKLDAGVPEKISLVSRDEKSILVVTYSDLKRCFDSTFQELISAASGQL
ncbi:PAN2-PAN3 deadenylation complex subunit pan3 isoform X5 [Paramormyrops kingsleyae]|uniref:PAN2-PAN3 deadenylation complex subunit pan3 isoform X5 n=1 Tax=Paramormyrops kingsleyae TaxID=1676925 RepID=UPI000CD5EC5A|nr:PAN2-PAN3 deadenylation complex subunit PAN3 isoform X5 [Paramormyrops kingsleyae]